MLSQLLTIFNNLWNRSAAYQAPNEIEVVKPFDLERYLGLWYEIARLENRFEKGLSHVNACYEQSSKGYIQVTNRGFNDQKNKWQQAKGKAYFISDKQTASLKVSFFGPFYGGYHVFYLADDYSHALVCGSNKSYLWILARAPQLPDETYIKLVNIAKENGFAVENLVKTVQ